MYKVTIDHPSIGPETDLYIHGLGTFKNGTTTEVPNSAIQNFRNVHSTVDHVYDEEGKATIESAKGPHPVDLEIFGVWIEKVDPKAGSTEPTGEEGK